MKTPPDLPQLTPDQLRCLAAMLMSQVEEQEKALNPIPAAQAVKKPAQRALLPKDLLRIEICDDPESEHCPCGCQLRRIDEEISEKLDDTPDVFHVERHIRRKWVFDQCETLTQASIPAQLNDNALDASVQAQMMITEGLRLRRFCSTMKTVLFRSTNNGCMMSAIRSFTAKDVCAALGGISRSRLHAWAQLPPFSERPTRERSARRYTKADLLTFAVLQTLENVFGAKSRDLSRVSATVHHYVSSPRQSSFEEWTFIPLAEGAMRLVQEQPIASIGWVVDMAKERERIDLYLGLTPPQQELPLITDIGSGR